MSTHKPHPDNTPDERAALLHDLVRLIEQHAADPGVVADVTCGIFLSAMMHVEGPTGTRERLRDLADQIPKREVLQ